MEHSKKRLGALIDQLVAICLDIDPQLLEGVPRVQQDQQGGVGGGGGEKGGGAATTLDHLKDLEKDKVKHLLIYRDWHL